ncbi:MAG: hypothetical protein ACREFY_04985 [Acetobacteraceae bacterium]
MKPRDRTSLESTGLRFSGRPPDGMRPEIIPLPEPPWPIGVQCHPGPKSKPCHARPLFAAFAGAAAQQARFA